VIFKNETRLEKILYCAESNSLYMRVYRIVAWYLSFKGIFRPRILVSPDKVLRILKNLDGLLPRSSKKLWTFEFSHPTHLSSNDMMMKKSSNLSKKFRQTTYTDFSVSRTVLFCAGKQFFTTSYRIFTIIQTSF